MASNDILTKLKARDETSKAIRSAEKGVAGFAKRAKSLFKGLLGPVAAFAGVAGLGLVSKKLFEIGSGAAEINSKFEAVFADNLPLVEAFNEEFGKIAGVSQINLKALTATTGAIAQGLGFAGEAAANLTIEITQLAGDLGSFNDIPTEQTARAIQSALTGERESLKRLGIVIKQVDVDQLALIQTGKDSTKQLNDQDRATATLALITEKAGVAVGDLARTQDSAANQARQIKAEFQNIADTIALGLLPAFTKLLPLIKDFATTISDALPKMAEFFLILNDFASGDEAAAQVRAIEESVRRAGLTAEQVSERRKADLAERQAAIIRLNELEKKFSKGFPGGRSAVTEHLLEIKQLREEIELLAASEVALEAIENRLVATAERLVAAEAARAPTDILAGLEAIIPRDLQFAIPEMELLTSEALSEAFDPEPLRLFNDELSETERLLELMGNETFTALTSAAEDTFEAIGAGGPAFEAMAKFTTRAVGKIAGAEGSRFILSGGAKIFEGAFPPNPALIAAGVGMVAKGGLLKALSGKLGAGGGGAGGGAGGRGPGGMFGDQNQGFGPSGEVTIVLPPGRILDMNNPALFEAFTKGVNEGIERGAITFEDA